MVLRIVLLAALGACVQAHRLDEYLQASLISLEPDSVTVELNLTPGVVVFGKVLALIDPDRDGSISPAERQTYATRVLNDISLAVDAHPRSLALVGVQFPPMEQMRDGLGTIRLLLQARFESLPRGPHELRFENRHQPEIGAFLANALLPADSISIARQSRDDRQTTINIGYSVRPSESARRVDARLLLAALLCAAALGGFLLNGRRL